MGRDDEDGESAWGRGEDGASARDLACLASLCETLPETLFAPYDPVKERFCFRGLGESEHVGLVVFSKRARAEEYSAALLACRGFSEVRRVTLDEACDRARTYNWRVDSVALIDDPRRPVVLTVR